MRRPCGPTPGSSLLGPEPEADIALWTTQTRAFDPSGRRILKAGRAYILKIQEDTSSRMPSENKGFIIHPLRLKTGRVHP